MTISPFFSSVLLLLMLNTVSESKYIEGQLSTKEDWAFLTRFCFLSDIGRFTYSFQSDPSYHPMYMLMYDDDEWPSVYHTDLTTCEEKTASLIEMNRNNLRIIPLDDQGFRFGCRYVAVDGQEKINCTSELTFQSSRSRWWFIAIGRCGGQPSDSDAESTGIDVNYQILMTNDDSNIMFRQFSADEFYLLQVDITFFLAETLIFIISIVYTVQLYNQQLLHATYKLYITSLAYEVAHLFVDVVVYGKYANDGINYYGGITFGNVLEAIGLLIFILMLLLLSKGFTITRGRISQKGTIMLIVFFFIYVVVYIILFILQAVDFDPGLVLYLYQSPAGYGLVGVRLVAWIWFVYNSVITIHRYRGQRSFFIPFLTYFTFWFWFSPVFILISNLRLDPWVRNTVTNGIDVGVNFAGYFFFLILTRPTAANENFPFKTRTFQVDPQNNLAPEFSGSAANYVANEQHVNFTDLFVVSHTRGPPPANSMALRSFDYPEKDSNGADSATQHTTAKPTATVAKTNANTATNTNPASITNMFRARSGSELAAEGYGQGLTGNASEAKLIPAPTNGF